ncbi:hypothetical protein PTT_10904 [Pyrenophora teres f. teres 0-1]|uniref:BYS1 domain protein n=1 Tax=Pyrenophora teres f. teres (strain 0-1) TaxID=861557 RepID=E3RQC4_PYRTT|nr:hypothetical protein PTT_10904 [Pyrenophora teres f. teres 0-1]
MTMIAQGRRHQNTNTKAFSFDNIRFKQYSNMLLNAITIVSLIAGAQAVGRAIVTNQCDAPIYLWSVGGSISDQKVITKDQSYSETFTKDPKSGGIALKMTTVEGGIFKPNVSQTIFAYNLDANQIWYDMTDIFGDGFAGRTMTLKPKDPACQSINWYGGKPTGGSQIKNCDASTDLELTFCTNHCLPSWCTCY